MPVQVSDVLHRCRERHDELSKIYHDVESSTKRTRLQMLLNYLEKQEKMLRDEMDQLETELSKLVLNSWLPFDVPLDDHPKVTTSSTASLNEWIEKAIQLDDELISSLDQAANETDKDNVKDVFESLAKQARKERNKFVRDALMMDTI